MANYPIPPWLHGPPDPSQILLHAHQIGAQIAMERARLQQQSQLEQIKLDLEQEQQDRQSRQKQQELDIEKSYRDQQVGLKQKALEEAQQKLDLQAKVAGQKYAAQQRIQQRIQSGEDPDRVYLEEGAAAGASMSGLSGFSHNIAMAKRPEGGLMDLPGGGSVIRQPSGTLTPWVRPPKASAPKLGQEDMFKAKDLTEQIRSITKELNTAKSATGQSDEEKQSAIIPIQERLLAAQSQRHKLFQKPSAGSGPDAPKAPIPLPKTEKELLEGQVYQTAKGLGMWDASQKQFKLMPSDQAPTPEAPPEDPEHPPDEE